MYEVHDIVVWPVQGRTGYIAEVSDTMVNVQYEDCLYKYPRDRFDRLLVSEYIKCIPHKKLEAPMAVY